MFQIEDLARAGGAGLAPDRIRAACDASLRRLGIDVIDLYTDDTFNAIDAETYAFYMFDPIHPTKAGYYEWWFPKMEADLIEILAD